MAGHTELVHIWNRCHACGAAPIIGPRFACQTCPSGADNDLCATCYRLFEQAQIEHPSPDAREAPAGRHLFRDSKALSVNELCRGWPFRGRLRSRLECPTGLSSDRNFAAENHSLEATRLWSFSRTEDRCC